MWCAKCQAPVGHASDGKPSQCPRCGTEVVDAPPENDATGQARALLERWATDDPLEATPQEAVTSSSQSKTTDTDQTENVDETASPPTPRPPSPNHRPARRNYRVDVSHANQQQPTKVPAASSRPLERPGGNATDQVQQPSTDIANTSQDTTNHDPLTSVASTLANISEASASLDSTDHTKPVAPDAPTTGHTAPAVSSLPPGATTNALTHSTSLWGQLLAYIGVLGLTIGGAMIVWNGFGHAPLNTPTSWLIATAGQMLLFLGIVTLVSSGLEQTNEEVTRQVRVLGEQLLRIEQGQDVAPVAPPHVAQRPIDSAKPLTARVDSGTDQELGVHTNPK